MRELQKARMRTMPHRENDDAPRCTRGIGLEHLSAPASLTHGALRMEELSELLGCCGVSNRCRSSLRSCWFRLWWEFLNMSCRLVGDGNADCKSIVISLKNGGARLGFVRHSAQQAQSSAEADAGGPNGRPRRDKPNIVMAARRGLSQRLRSARKRRCT